MTHVKEQHLKCACCHIILDFQTDEYHVINKSRWCVRCYVASHHLNLPTYCPFLWGMRSIMNALSTMNLTQAEADQLCAFIAQRVRYGI